jgi:hypothetical protein
METIKIDIDGNALPILHDIEPVLAGGAFRGLMIEIYKDSDYRADILAYLARYGFRPFTFGRPKNVFFKLREAGPTRYDPADKP